MIRSKTFKLGGLSRERINTSLKPDIVGIQGSFQMFTLENDFQAVPDSLFLIKKCNIIKKYITESLSFTLFLLPTELHAPLQLCLQENYF